MNKPLSDLDARLVREGIAKASAFNAAGQYDAATAAAQQALARAPRSPEAIYELGVAALLSGHHDQAIDDFGLALNLRPRWAEPYERLAQALQAAGRPVDALAAIDSALGFNPASAAVRQARGNILLTLGQHHEAMAAYRSVLALEPDHQGAAQILRTLAETIRDTASPRYVANHFDRYAPVFEEHLTRSLGYVAPSRIAAVLPPGPVGEVLDLGCGTGLVAAALADRFKAIDGVDLSPRMIDLAGAKQLYRALHLAEAGAFLATTTHQYDLVTAADVLIYIGSLESLFPQVWARLRPGGRFAFSIETTTDSRDFALQPTGRFAHSAAYVALLGTMAGLTLETEMTSTLRQGSGQAVVGQICVFVKPG